MTDQIAWALIIFEVVLGLLIVLRISERAVAKTAIIALILFSSAIAVLLWRYPTAPACHCTGDWHLFSMAVGDNLFGFARNVVFLFICVLFHRNLR